MNSTAEFTVKRSLRLSQRQDEQINAICEETGLSFSAYIRTLLNDKPNGFLMSKEERLQRAALITEINRIGVNINQIVKNVNSYFYSKEEKKELHELLTRVYTLMEQKL